MNTFWKFTVVILLIILALLIAIFLVDMSKDREYEENTEILTDHSIWLHRVVGSRYRIISSCSPANYAWFESKDNLTFTKVSTRRDLILKIDHYYYATVVCGSINLTSVTITPCTNLTAYFNYYPETETIRPRISLMNLCPVDSIQWFIGDSLSNLTDTSSIEIVSGEIYKLIYTCTDYGCSSDTLKLRLLRNNFCKIVYDPTTKLIKLETIEGLTRSQVTWYSKNPTMGGWGESTGGSYSTYEVKTIPGYKYYARVQIGVDVYVTNYISI